MNLKNMWASLKNTITAFIATLKKFSIDWFLYEIIYASPTGDERVWILKRHRLYGTIRKVKMDFLTKEERDKMNGWVSS